MESSSVLFCGSTRVFYTRHILWLFFILCMTLERCCFSYFPLERVVIRCVFPLERYFFLMGWVRLFNFLPVLRV
ncbi:hypothetical protein L211DRAFT_578226 [Terfezia boudieri ATCC MYA-4762]|uniref:Uncharacterized protein n=1 Tax=Terfezia boudieri ATCC MYA-4762 TaxID=1051890 RepID=A0A3N4LAX0_9PEZI|nr:hypothetical protein L211DRAFT_578226 [Terfezia boudieri ATCC MYA-4762]